MPIGLAGCAPGNSIGAPGAPPENQFKIPFRMAASLAFAAGVRLSSVKRLINPGRLAPPTTPPRIRPSNPPPAASTPPPVDTAPPPPPPPKILFQTPAAIFQAMAPTPAATTAPPVAVVAATVSGCALAKASNCFCAAPIACARLCSAVPAREHERIRHHSGEIR